MTDDALETGIAALIFECRGQQVILDADLAHLFEVRTGHLNQRARDAAKRFDWEFSFQLDREEWGDLKSRNAISSQHGGRRTRPWAYTEHGVVVVATTLRSEPANRITRHIIEVFVAVSRSLRATNAVGRTLPVLAGQPVSRALTPVRSEGLLSRLLDRTIAPDSERTTREELVDFTDKGLTSIKEFLRQRGLANAEIEAGIGRILAETAERHAGIAASNIQTARHEFALDAARALVALEQMDADETGDTSDLKSILRELALLKPT